MRWLLAASRDPLPERWREFDESDETNIHELAALIGETLDALRLAARRPA
jgi:hypothetical protein